MSKVGKKFIYKGVHIGKVIADVDYSSFTFVNTYFVLLNKVGREIFGGWWLQEGDNYERKKFCGKYGKNPNNRFYVFSKNSLRSKFFEFENDSKPTVMENE